MKLFDLLPKFIKRSLVLRDYRITKAELSIVQNRWIPSYRNHVENYGDKYEHRSKEYYEAMLQNYLDLELLLKEHFEELKDQMRNLGLELE